MTSPRQGAAMIRRTLPQRRAAETFTFVCRNQPVTITAGFYDDGTLGEVFVTTGVSIDAIRHAVTRNGTEPASILGAVVDRISADSFLGGTR